MGGFANLALIVEGHGDVAAAPVLVRRILEAQGMWPAILPPHRVGKSRMVSELNRAIRLQLARVGALGGVLILLDADSDEPKMLSERLQATVDADLVERCRVVVATKEYEAWFLGGIESLRSHKSVRDDATFDDYPEGPRDAKGKLASLMNESYQETIHQVAFSSLVDLQAIADKCPSFVRFSECLIQLVELKAERPGNS